MKQNGLIRGTTSNSFSKINVLNDSKNSPNKSFSLTSTCKLNRSTISHIRSLGTSNKSLKKSFIIKTVQNIKYKNRSRTPIETTKSIDDMTQSNLELKEKLNLYKLQIYKYKKQIGDLEKETKEQLEQIALLLNDNQLAINDKATFDVITENYIIYSLKQQHRDDLKAIEELKETIQQLKKNIKLTKLNEYIIENNELMTELTKIRSLYSKSLIQLKSLNDNSNAIKELRIDNSKKDFIIMNLTDKVESMRKEIANKERYISELNELLSKQKKENKLNRYKLKNSVSICERMLNTKFIEFQGENNDISEVVSDTIYNELIYIIGKNFESRGITINHIQSQIVSNIKYNLSNQISLCDIYKQLSEGVIKLLKGIKYNDYFFIRSFIKTFLYKNFVSRKDVLKKEKIESLISELFQRNSQMNSYKEMAKNQKIATIVNNINKKCKEVDYMNKGYVTLSELKVIIKEEKNNSVLKDININDFVDYLVFIMKKDNKSPLGLFELAYNKENNRRSLTPTKIVIDDTKQNLPIQEEKKENIVDAIKTYLNKEKKDFNSFIVSIVNSNNKGKVALSDFQLLLAERKIEYDRDISKYDFIKENEVDIELLKKVLGIESNNPVEKQEEDINYPNSEEDEYNAETFNNNDSINSIEKALV